MRRGCSQAVRTGLTIALAALGLRCSGVDAAPAADLAADEWDYGAPGTVNDVGSEAGDDLEVDTGDGFFWPTRRPWVTSHFGERRGRHRRHNGIDLAGGRGEPILATAAGKVTFAGYARGYGRAVYIEHAGGFESRYAHASAVLVREGQTVYRGQPIARIGRTGNAHGTHCHFELRKDGVPVNPLARLRPLG